MAPKRSHSQSLEAQDEGQERSKGLQDSQGSPHLADSPVLPLAPAAADDPDAASASQGIRRKRITGKRPEFALVPLRCGPKAADGPPEVQAGLDSVFSGARGHYDVLGLDRTATPAEVRRAYRRQAMRTHPDKGGRAELFLSVINSFEVLADVRMRAEYDRSLDRQGCSDGVQTCSSKQKRADKQAAEADAQADKAKALRGLAHSAFLKMMWAETFTWGTHLADMPENLLAALSEFIKQKMKGIKQKTKGPEGRRLELDPADFPREVAPPEGLPSGWKCMQHMYLTGKCKGLTYMRYTSPWGKKNIASVAASLREHSRHTGEKLESVRRAASSSGSNPAMQSTQRMPPHKTTQQRCIYTVPKADGRHLYYVQANWACFRISSKRTENLQEAIDWHIALSQIKEMWRVRMQSDGESPRPYASPMTHEELLHLAETEPDLQLTFYSNFNNADNHNIHTPTTQYFEAAIDIYHRFKMLLNAGASQQMFEEERQKLREEIYTRNLAQEDRLMQLNDMVSKKLGRPDSALTDWRLKQRQLPAALPGDFVKRRRLADAEGGAPRALAELGANGSSSSAPSAINVAVGLQAALGLDNKEALKVARHARRMTVAERNRRLKVFMAYVPQDRLQADARCPGRPSNAQLQARARLEDAEQHTPPRVRSFSSAGGRGGEVSPRAALTETADHASPLKVTATEARQALMLTDTGGQAQSSTAAPSTPVAVEASWLPGVAARSSQSACFSLVEVCRLRAVSVDAARASSIEMRGRLKDYSYPDGLEPAPQYTRGGRLLKLRATLSHQILGARLVNLLTWRRHAALFQSLDLRHAPVVESLESEDFIGSLRRMTHLVRIVLPSVGWSCPSKRLSVIRALPEGTPFLLVNPHGKLQQDGIGGPSCGDCKFKSS